MTDHAFPNETSDYRTARNELLEAERALRDEVERVAALRRTLPLGGTVREDYVFDELNPAREKVQVSLSQLFASGTESLLLYGYMFAPDAKQPCPLCTSFIDALDGNAHHLDQRMNVAVVAKAPIERFDTIRQSRGWRHIRMLSSSNNTYQADYFAEDAEGNQWPMANVFVKRNGTIHHFWGSELLFHGFEGGDMRHVDQLWPLWNVLDLTPEGRGRTWYPALSYED